MSGHRVPGAVLVAAGLAIGLEATTFDVAFLTDPVGPKALPLLVAAMLVVAGVHAALEPPPRASPPTRSAGWKIAAAVGALILYPALLGVLGFFLSTTAVVGALSALYGAPFRRGLLAAVGLSAGLWLLFVRVLALPLPIGTLWIR